MSSKPNLKDLQDLHDLQWQQPRRHSFKIYLILYKERLPLFVL